MYVSFYLELLHWFVMQHQAKRSFTEQGRSNKWSFQNNNYSSHFASKITDMPETSQSNPKAFEKNSLSG